MANVLSTLNNGEPNALPDAIRQVRLGDVIAGLVPRRIVRTGLTSGTVHIEPEPGAVTAVSLVDGAVLTVIDAGAPGAGDVLAAYDGDGVATLTFNAAQTGYRVVKQVLPASLATVLAADNGTGS